MIVLAQPGYGQFTESLPRLDFERGLFTTARFANGEMQIGLGTPVTNQVCIVVGTIAPPEQNLVSIAMLSHTLKKEGASKVIAMLPYMGYSRQDKTEAGKSLAIQWLGDVLKTSGASEVWTIDVHSDLDVRLFPIKLRSLSPASLFASRILELKQPGVTVVAPDTGAIKRARAVSDAAAVPRPVCYFHKVRLNGVEHLRVFGNVSEKVVIIDDMLDTGSTLLSCVGQLRKLGVQKISVVVSHGLFTGSKWKQLFTLGVDKLYCLDTIPEVVRRKEPQIRVIASKLIIEDALKKLSSQREEQSYAFTR